MAYRDTVSELFGEGVVAQFSDEYHSHFSVNGASSFRDSDSITAKLMYELLKRTQPGYVLNRFMQAFLITCPLSVITERVVSSYKELKANRRSSMNRDTINMHLRIALNSAATAHFDPRPAVVEFFKSKDRRIRETDQCLFQRREFVENFSNKT